MQPGQAQCACGQYVDLPSNEFYARLENKVEQSSKENSIRGLLIGIGFLFLFVLLEKIMDIIFIAELYGAGIFLVLLAAVIGFNLWQIVRKFLL
ncbi:MAG: hypothetical protein F4Y44_03215 [Chloroflexi bacterium]|nr:hypothetical protein [Chloroflexota bacterium]